jgi:hypothetical protein
VLTLIKNNALADVEGKFMNKLKMNCCKMPCLRRRSLLAMIVITTLMPIPLFAETVPIIVEQTPYYTYSVSLGGGVCNPGDAFSLYSGEYPTKAEALAAALGIHKTVQCYGPYEGHCDISVQADPNPDRWQFWYTCYFNSSSETKHMWKPFYATYHTKHSPTPTTRTEVPYTPDANGRTCSRPDNLTITLSGGTEVEPSNGSDKKFLAIIATVKDQNNQPPTTPVTVRISLKVDPKTGGHDHGDSTRPRGGVAEVETCASDSECWSNATDSGGTVMFNFNTPEASGKHTITATCDRCSNTATKPVDVKVANLIPIPASSLYALQDSAGHVIGAIPGKHTHNHYLTAAAIDNLNNLADTYNSIINPGQRLYLNDASLEWGGLFDVGSTAWKPPHQGHRRGVEIDIRAAAAANGTLPREGAIPFDLFWNVWSEARKQGIKADLHCMENSQLVLGSSCYWLPEARHFHVNLR